MPGMSTHPGLNVNRGSGGPRGILEKREENMYGTSPLDGDLGDSKFLTVDYALKVAMAVETPPESCATSPTDVRGVERSYFEYYTSMDEEMKEN